MYINLFLISNNIYNKINIEKCVITLFFINWNSILDLSLLVVMVYFVLIFRSFCLWIEGEFFAWKNSFIPHYFHVCWGYLLQKSHDPWL